MAHDLMNQNIEVVTHAEGALDIPDDLYEVVSFNDIYQQKKDKASGILSSVLNLLSEGASMKGVADSLKKDTQYIVEMSDEMKAAIEAGEYVLDTNKEGEIFAQLRDAAGHFGEKFPIKKELIAAGLNPMEVSQALQMKALEKKMDQMIDMLGEIGEDVEEVVQGQQNDRIGLFNSGLNLYLESKTVQDETFQKMIAAQALKSLSDANEQLVLAIHEDVKYLSSGKYKKAKGKSEEAIQEKMNDINKCFEVVHRCYLLKASVYTEKNEIQAVLSTLNEYGKFLQREIVPNAELLGESDSLDRSLTEGKWERRALAFEDLKNVRKELAQSQTYYLVVGVQTNG